MSGILASSDIENRNFPSDHHIYRRVFGGTLAYPANSGYLVPFVRSVSSYDCASPVGKSVGEIAAT